MLAYALAHLVARAGMRLAALVRAPVSTEEEVGTGMLTNMLVGISTFLVARMALCTFMLTRRLARLDCRAQDGELMPTIAFDELLEAARDCRIIPLTARDLLLVTARKLNRH
jgi:hypothetical protein